MEMRGQDKEIEMPTTLGYNPNPPKRESSSKLSSSTLASTIGERSDHETSQTHSILQPPEHHNLYHPPPPSPLQQLQRPRRDPDPSSSPIATTSVRNTSIAARGEPSPQPQPPPQAQTGVTTTSAISTPLIRYRECLKNHAASMGGHVVDGCGEFMPSGEEGTPESLRCAACECHRNFHRKEAEGETQHVSNYYSYANKNNDQNRIPSPHHHSQYPHFSTVPSSLHQQHHRFSHGFGATPSAGMIPPMMMAFGSGGGPAESSSEDLNMFQSNAGGQSSVQPPLSKKRFRTKFTQQQKDKMMEFADKLGWKIQKHDEQEVQQFCSQVGVKRQVFKVWMHNNKQAMKKKQV
ncbi:hypothetical protein L6164_020046 [Bauhinia variegata]|uniref:Uncharacterized protein n=1 Tax=Bauhinia variegata TaxID=167791 RepID=A0ACB9MU47_BAUVA|nr:hypothetical protein L6164_020046 [Bauhinia variegata]